MQIASSPSTVWLLYGNGVSPQDAFCNPRNDPNEAENLGPHLKKELEKAGFKVELTWDGSDIYDVAAVISWDVNDRIIHNLCRYPKERCFLFAFEPPVVKIDYYTEAAKSCFGKIFVMFQDLVDNKKTFKFHFPLSPIRWKRAQNPPPFASKKLCAFMNSNKFFGVDPNELYLERARLVAFFSTKTNEFDLYGSGWNFFSCWKGEVSHEGTAKAETLKNYKFTIAFENTKGAGHITDKLFPAMVGLSVPIYLGATDITNYVPKTCFIDFRDFSSYEELYLFLKNMDQKTHESYLSSARDFLDCDPRRDLFTPTYFTQNILQHLFRLR